MSNMRKKYESVILPALKATGAYPNPFQMPKIKKIVVNIGVGTKVDRDGLNQAVDEIAKITGQRPLITKAKNSISNFRLREGMPIGAKVTLRGVRMYEFLDRLINVALPRIRDFRGTSPKSFDGRGNYSLGIHEHNIFPELDPNEIKRNQGMDVAIVTTAKTDSEATELLRGFGMPFAVPGDGQ